MMIRGVGDPLVAIYLRAYLARKGKEIAPQLTEHLTTSFNDYLYTHQIVIQRYKTIFLSTITPPNTNALAYHKAYFP